MTIKKIGGTLAVVITMLGFNSIALAEDNCASQIEEIRMLEMILNCDKSWGYGNPIWQFQGGKGKNKDVTTDGCDIHTKLSRLLNETRTEEPPIQGGKKGKGKGNNQVRGAANDLADHKYQSAVDQLQLFRDTIENDAKVNLEFVLVGDPKGDADDWANHFKRRAKLIQEQIEPETYSCSP